MKFNHINDCWNYVLGAETKEELEKRLGELPRWSGDWWIEESENGNCLVVNDVFNEQYQDYETREEETSIPYSDEFEDEDEEDEKEEEIKVVANEEDTCPYCGSKNIVFGNRDEVDNQVCYACECEDCGGHFNEWYDIRFSTMYVGKDCSVNAAKLLEGKEKKKEEEKRAEDAKEELPTEDEIRRPSDIDDTEELEEYVTKYLESEYKHEVKSFMMEFDSRKIYISEIKWSECPAEEKKADTESETESGESEPTTASTFTKEQAEQLLILDGTINKVAASDPSKNKRLLVFANGIMITPDAGDSENHKKMEKLDLKEVCTAMFRAKLLRFLEPDNPDHIEEDIVRDFQAKYLNYIEDLDGKSVGELVRVVYYEFNPEREEIEFIINEDVTSAYQMIETVTRINRNI